MSIETDETQRLDLPVALGEIKYVQSKYFNQVVTRLGVDLIVLHCMESPETPQRAEQCANYMATLSELDKDGNPVKKSAHYYVDCDSVVQGVPEERIAYHAPGANGNGIGIEHAGRAFQKRADWLDSFGRRMLHISALLAVKVSRHWRIPIQFVDAERLLSRPQMRGITTHAEVTKAFKRSTHTDPGPEFPIDWYIQHCKLVG